MKAITLHQPSREDLRAYLAGVCVGDGWKTDLTIGLRCKDREFAEAFAFALLAVYDAIVVPRTDERGYWLVRAGNRSGRFNDLTGFEPGHPSEQAYWLRGLFDSEGNASLIRRESISENSYARRVAFYSTNSSTLLRAAGYLDSLGMATVLSSVKPTAGHKGPKPVFEMRLRASRDQFRIFADVVGSFITRKNTVLQTLARTYGERSEYCRTGGTRGSAARVARRDAGGKY